MADPLRVVILKPSKYTADGYVERFRWGFMPNSTVPHVRSMTSAVLGGTPVEVYTIDEYVTGEESIMLYRGLNQRARRVATAVRLLVWQVGCEMKPFANRGRFSRRTWLPAALIVGLSVACAGYYHLTRHSRGAILNGLRDDINAHYGHREGVPCINGGPCGRLAKAFRQQWNARFREKVNIAFVMTLSSADPRCDRRIPT
jgi:hypothetical protein